MHVPQMIMTLIWNLCWISESPKIASDVIIPICDERNMCTVCVEAG
jgi:hypothetical protein